MKRLWRLLRNPSDLAGVEAVWRENLKNEFDFLKPFIRPTNRLAKTYPCPYPAGDGCPRGIYQDGPDRFTAYCGESPKRCEELTLTRKDLVIHEFNLAGFAAQVLRLLQIKAKTEPIAGYPGLWRVGTYIPIANHKFSVYMLLATEPEDFRRAVDHLLAFATEPFLLLAPSDEYLDEPHRAALERKRSGFLALNEFLVWKDREIALVSGPEDILAPFRKLALPGGHVDAGHAARLFSREHPKGAGVTDQERQEILGPGKKNFDLIVDGFSDEVWHPQLPSKKPRHFDRKWHVWVLFRLAVSGRPLAPSQIGELNRVGQDKGDEAESDKARAEQINKMRRMIEPDAASKQYHYIKTMTLEGGVAGYHFDPDPGLRYALLFPPEEDE